MSHYAPIALSVIFGARKVGVGLVPALSHDDRGRGRALPLQLFLPQSTTNQERRHPPRVKSGNFTGALPCATDASLNGAGTLHAAAS